MSELFEQIDRLRRVEGRAALATLVSTRGTTPRKEGAQMWVGEGGRVLGSVTIGGCVDAEVMTEAQDVLADSTPRLLSLDLGDEDAWEIGLTCGGVVEVFVEPVALGRSAGDESALGLYETLRSHLAGGGAGAVVTRLDPPGGAKLLVLDDGRRAGTLGDPALDEAAGGAAREALARDESGTRVLGPGEAVRCFVETHVPAPTLLVVGAGHVAMPLITLARPLGFRTVVVDGRPRFATRERFPDADQVLVGMPSEVARQAPGRGSTAFVLVAHDYKYDLPVLRHAVSTPAGYIGMLGSRRRGQTILRMLREEGLDEASLGRIRVPIGLDLGGRSAPEIALAILAEVVAARHGGSGRPLGQVKPLTGAPDGASGSATAVGAPPASHAGGGAG